MFQIDPAFFPRSVESRTKVLCTLCYFYILQLIILPKIFFFDLTVCLNLDSLSVVSFCTNPAFAYPIVRREFILESWLMIQLTLRDLSLYRRIRDTSGYKEYILLFNSYMSTLKFGLFLLVLDVFFSCK